jgi:hypothetical protein
MAEPAVVIDVQVCKHDRGDVARIEPKRTKARADFLLRLQPEFHFPSDVGVQRPPAREQMRALPGIDDDRALIMLDQPGVGRDPWRPVPVGKDRKEAQRIRPAAFRLRRLDPHPACLNGMNLHGDPQGSAALNAGDAPHRLVVARRPDQSRVNSALEIWFSRRAGAQRRGRRFRTMRRAAPNPPRLAIFAVHAWCQ